MKKITKITPEQEARFGEYVEEWTKIGLSTGPCNRPKAEAAITELYALAKLKKPQFIWTPCPLSAAIAASFVSAVGSAVHSAVRSAVRSAVDSAVGSAVHSAVDSAVHSAVGSAVHSAVHSAVGSAVGSAVDSAVGSAVHSAVGSAVHSAVRSAVDSAVGSAVDSAVGSAVGSAVDSAVHSAVDSAVGSAVDSAVRSAVGSAVDSAVGSAVDSAVGSAVDSAVHSAVHSADIRYFYPLWGNQWSGYAAWADFFRTECAIDVSEAFIDHCKHAHFYWPLEGFCFCSERPSAIYVDDAGRSHSEVGPAVEYATGWGPHCWHGTTIPPEWVTGQKPTASEALSWGNMEQRRAACEIVGWHNILRELNAVTIHKDPNPFVGELLEVDIPDVGREKFLRVKCGTDREFALPVPPDMQRATQAQAWLNFTTEDMYLPNVRT